MPALSNPTLWRTKPYRGTAKAYILDPPVFWTCSVNQSSFTYPVTTLTYDNADATAGLAFYRGQVIRVESSGGTFKGYCYLRGLDTSTTTITIARTGQGDVDFADNDVLKFLHWYQPRTKIPDISSTGELLKDDDVGWDNNSLIISGGGSSLVFGANAYAQEAVPLADAGVWYARDIGSLSGAIVTFDGSNSYTLNGATYLWTSQSVEFYGGAPAVVWTDEDTATPSGTFKQGIHWATLTVTDDTNGYSAQQHVLVVVCGDSFPALEIENMRLRGDLDNGWAATFNVMNDDVSSYPRNAPVLVWAEEDYGATKNISLNGDDGREHMKFCGYLSSDTTTLDGFVSDWDVEATNLLGFMRNLTGFSQFLEAIPASESGLGSLPTQQGQFYSDGLSVWTYLYYILSTNTNFFSVASIELPTYGGDYKLVALDVPDGTLDGQLALIAESLAAKVTCDHVGRLYFRRNPHYMSDSDRAALTTIVTLLASDRTGTMTINANEFRDAAWMVGWGGLADGETETIAKCGAPGDSPGQGRDKTVANGQIVQDQDELNTRIGRMYAYRNRDVRDTSIQIINPGQIADPAWQEWVKLTLAASSNTRGLNYSAAEWVLKAVDISYDAAGGWSDETWTLEIPVATGTADATTLPVLPDGGIELSVLPPFTPPEPVTPPETFSYEWGRRYDFRLSDFGSNWTYPSYTKDWVNGLGLRAERGGADNWKINLQTPFFAAVDFVAVRLIFSKGSTESGSALTIVGGNGFENIFTGSFPTTAEKTYIFDTAESCLRVSFLTDFGGGLGVEEPYYLHEVWLWGNGTDPLSGGQPLA